MALIGRQQSSGAFLKLDDISSQFDGSTSTFNLTVGGGAFFPINPYTLLVSLAGVIQEPISAFTINQNQINFASAPRAGAQSIDLHGRAFAAKDRAGNTHSIAFNLA